ncbi:MAG TPA: hypothetical protein VM680_15880, partial [Verrucomicrobiae bacterium]|nr:hypothetical protein [Verrucomicrobiae bacterium]
MHARAEKLQPSLLTPKSQLTLVLAAAAAFHLAFTSLLLAPLILVYLGYLIELSRARTARSAFYSGIALGMLVFAP